MAPSSSSLRVRCRVQLHGNSSETAGAICDGPSAHMSPVDEFFVGLTRRDSLQQVVKVAPFLNGGDDGAQLGWRHDIG